MLVFTLVQCPWVIYRTVLLDMMVQGQVRASIVNRLQSKRVILQ